MTTKKERSEQTKKINAKLDELNAKLKESAEVATNKGYDAKDTLDAKIAEAKDTVEKLKDRSKSYADQLRGKMSDEMNQAHLRHESLRETLRERKEANDAAKLAKYIDDMLEYSDDCVELSLLFAAESKLALLEAMLAMEEYDEKYGEGEEE